MEYFSKSVVVWPSGRNLLSDFRFPRPEGYELEGFEWDWSWEDWGTWGEWPYIEARGGGRYKNNIIVVGINLNGLGVICYG